MIKLLTAVQIVLNYNYYHNTINQSSLERFTTYMTYPLLKTALHAVSNVQWIKVHLITKGKPSKTLTAGAKYIASYSSFTS